MADPITLFGISGVLLTKILNDKAGEWIIGNYVGSSATEGLKLLKKVTGLWSKDGLPRNEHLLKALQTAKLNATSPMVMFFSQHLKNRGDKAESEQLEKAYSRWIEDQKSTIANAAETIDGDELYKRIELVLASQKGEEGISAKKAFILLAKEELWKEFEYGIGKYHYQPTQELKNRLLQGWAIEGKVLDWFDLVTLFFTTILKDQKHPESQKAQVAFVNRLLAELTIEQQVGLEELRKTQQKILEELKPLKESADKQQAQVEQWLTGILHFVNPQPTLVYDYSGHEGIREITTLFKARSVPLLGREAEVESLHRFMDSDGQLQWWVIQGEGGTGKSRLALEFCIHIAGRDIAKGFMLYEHWSAFNWGDWQPRCPTLVIIDYAATYSDELLGVMKNLYQRKGSLGYPVKLLLLEREAKGTWWDRFEQQQLAGNIPKIWNGQPLKLEPIGRENIWSIFKETGKEAIQENNKQAILQAFHGIDELERPLFAIFAALAIAAGEDIRGWDKTRLLDAELARQEANIWQPRCGKDGETLRRMKLFCALTTLCSGLETAQVNELLGKEYKWMPTEAELEKDLYEDISTIRKAVDGTETYRQMEPDILGEFFLLKTLEAENEKRFSKVPEIIKEAWNIKPVETGATTYRCFEDFEKKPLQKGLLPSSVIGYTVEAIEWYGKLLFSLSTLYSRKGKMDEAVKYYEDLQALAELNIEEIFIQQGRCATNLIAMLGIAGRIEEAKIYYEHLKKLTAYVHKEIFVAQGKAASVLVMYLGIVGKIEEAEMYYRHLQELTEYKHKEIFVAQANAAHVLELYLYDAGKIEEAKIYYEYLQELKSAAYTLTLNLGNAGRIEKAEVYYSHLQNLAKGNNEKIFIEQAKVAYNLIISLIDVNRIEEAEVYNSHIGNLLKHNNEEIEIQAMKAAYNLEVYFSNAGKIEEAREYFVSTVMLAYMLRNSSTGQEVVYTLKSFLGKRDIDLDKIFRDVDSQQSQ